MSRYTLRQNAEKPKATGVANPWMRALGLFVVVGLTWGGYMVAGQILASKYFPLPFSIPVEPIFRIPRFKFPFGNASYGPFLLTYTFLFQVGIAILVMILAYALLTIFWSFFDRPKLGPLDAPQPRSSRPESRSR